ncbi:MAG: TIGR01777 family oxidoreductase [Syntrophobacteraceae bacterium]
MKVLITGGLGFVGTQLCIRFLESGHEVTLIGRSPQPKPYTPRQAGYVSADTTIPGPWQEVISAQNVIVNLAGASIFGKWDEAYKKLLYDSRILTTRNVVQAMSSDTGSTLLSTSAVGYYGFRGDEELMEESPPGDDFLAKLCVDWEGEALEARKKGARVVLTRFGIVLGKDGGALKQMIPAFRKFVGGPLGSGKQWFSWIHMRDLLNALFLLVDRTDIHGPVNCCSPNAVRNKDLAVTLGKTLHRPSYLPTPAFMLRLVLGEFASALVEGQRVVPSVLLQAGFTFQYSGLADALRNILNDG